MMHEYLRTDNIIKSDEGVLLLLSMTGYDNKNCTNSFCLHYPICRQYESQSCVGIMDAINPQWMGLYNYKRKY